MKDWLFSGASAVLDPARTRTRFFKGSSLRAILAIAVPFLAISSGPAKAQTATWDGTTNSFGSPHWSHSDGTGVSGTTGGYGLIINSGTVNAGGIGLADSPSSTPGSGDTTSISLGGGTLNITGGDLHVGEGSNVSTSVTVSNSSTLSVSGIIYLGNAGSGALNIGTGAGDTTPGTVSATAVNFGAGTGSLVFNHGSAGYTFSTNITSTGTDPGSVVVTNGTTILSGNNTYYGTTSVASGATLKAGATTAFSANSAYTVAGTLDLNGNSNSIGSLAGAGTVTNSGAAAALTISGGASTVFSGSLTGTLGLALSNGSSLTLNNATPNSNTYSGATTVGDGTNASTLTAGAANVFSANSAMTVAAASTVDLGSFAQSIKSLGGSGTVTDSGAAALTISGGTSTTFSGALTGTLGLALSNGSSLTLNNATPNSNTYSGATTVGDGTNASTLTAGAANVFSANSAMTVAAASTLNLNGFSNSIGSLAGAGTVQSTGGAATLTTGNDNTSTVFAGNLINGTGTLSLTKTGSGTLGLAGTNTYTGATTVNGGAIEVTGTGSITASASLTNNAGFQLDSGSAATFTGVATNNSVFNNLGGTLTATSFTNNGTVNASGGSFAEAVTNNNTYNATGTTGVTGAFNNASGANLNVSSAGNLTIGGFLTNNGFVTVAQGGVLNDTTGITNSGTITNYGTVNDALTNTGTLNNFGTYNVTGNFNNSGTINMVNGSPTNVVNVSGNYVATGGSNMGVDATLVSGGAADQLRVVGTVTGNTIVNFNDVGSKGYFATPIPVVTTGGGTGTFTAGTGLQSAGIVNYALEKVGNNWDVVATLNPGAAPTFATSIAASLAAINVGFFQNASAFVSAPPDPKPNQVGGGPWIRVADGRNDVSAIGVTQNVGGATTANSLVRTTFNGFQTGVDLGLFNIQNTGYNLHFGVTGGQVLLSAAELESGISTAEITVPFVGLYGAFTGHNFFADFQVREDFYQMKISNPTALLSSSNLDGTGVSVNGSLGYRFDVTRQFFIEPSIAVLYSQLHINSLRVGIDPADNVYGNLSFDPINSLIGRIGVRIGTNYVFDSVGIGLQPFVTGSLWREFEGDTVSNFSAAGGNVPVLVTRIGSFEQIGVGLAAQVLNTGLLGFVRGDYRVGPNISGYALNAGLRYQF